MKINFARIFVLSLLFVLMICQTHTLQAQVELTINNPANIAGTYTNTSTASFGPPVLTVGPITGNLVASDDIEGCSPLVNAAAIMGNIALIDRGSCQFQQKTGNAQGAGAIAVIICLIDDSSPFPMSGVNDTITIPTIQITKALCDQIRMELPGVNVTIESVITNCTNSCAINYNPDATEDDGTCIFPSSDDGCDLTTDGINTITCEIINTPPDIDDGCPNTDDNFDAANCQILHVSNCPPGTVLVEVSCTCVNDDVVVGCTASCATNYNPNATVDDGSCTVPSLDDGCDLTVDILDPATCAVTNIPPDVDDSCIYTTDSWDAANCLIVNTPDVDDGCPNTDDSFVFCQILNVSNCPEGTELDATTCTCVQVCFDEGVTITAENEDAAIVFVADIDGDGDNDIISSITSSTSPTVWYENDGMGNFTENIISTDDAYALYVADLDNDGDNDVLFSANNMIGWYANDGAGNFGSANIIDQGIFTHTFVSLFIADMDGDGDNDVITDVDLNNTGFSNDIMWYANDGNGNFAASTTITTGLNDSGNIYVIDIDGDGDNDVLSASSIDDILAWYANDGTGNFGPQNIIATNVGGKVALGDMDGDGDIDIVASGVTIPSFAIAWYANDGSGNFSAEMVINSLGGGGKLLIADVDGDGDNDVVGQGSWYPNDGNGNFTGSSAISNSLLIVDMFAADLDGDGDNDLAAAIFNGGVVWFENTCGTSAISGCTNPNACNFDATATIDDGSCILFVISINDQSIPDGTYQADNEVNSIGTVPVGGNVNFKAGQTILLDNNFAVQPNADFSAEIEDCTGQ